MERLTIEKKLNPNKIYHNYKDEVEELRFSDHSPVSCTFVL